MLSPSFPPSLTFNRSRCPAIAPSTAAPVAKVSSRMRLELRMAPCAAASASAAAAQAAVVARPSSRSARSASSAARRRSRWVWRSRSRRRATASSDTCSTLLRIQGRGVERREVRERGRGGDGGPGWACPPSLNLGLPPRRASGAPRSRARARRDYTRPHLHTPRPPHPLAPRFLSLTVSTRPARCRRPRAPRASATRRPAAG